MTAEVALAGEYWCHETLLSLFSYILRRSPCLEQMTVMGTGSSFYSRTRSHTLN